MLDFIKEEKKQMKSKKIRQQAKETMGKLLLTKGLIYQFRLRNLKECERCYTEALEYKKQINDILGCAKANGLLAKYFYTIAVDLKERNFGEHSYTTQNNLERAISYYDQYYLLTSKIENKEGLIEAAKGLGNCYLELNKYNDAIKNYEKCAQRAIEFKDKVRKVDAYCQLIKAHILKEGDDKEDEYKKYLDEILEICQEEPRNKKIHGHRKDLMDFIEEHKQKHQKKLIEE